MKSITGKAGSIQEAVIPRCLGMEGRRESWSLILQVPRSGDSGMDGRVGWGAPRGDRSYLDNSETPSTQIQDVEIPKSGLPLIPGLLR